MYNIKRRIASLPPVTLETFNSQLNRDAHISEASSPATSSKNISTPINANEQVSENEEEDQEATPSPYQCLFCPQNFPCSNTGFSTNLSHMHTSHGLSIPHPTLVSDMQTLVSYLATEVYLWHECLYCGAIKPSTSSIQSHMRDKGHCRLNFDREPELLDFWEKRKLEGHGNGDDDSDSAAVEQQGRLTNVSETEIRFASGKIVGSRYAVLESKKASRKRRIAASTTSPTMLALPQDPEDAGLPPQLDRSHLSSGRQLARREEMSIAGISTQQRQALVLAEKKAQRSEAVARRAREWVYAKGGNSQEFDQLDNRGKWGKQNHKLLPR